VVKNRTVTAEQWAKPVVRAEEVTRKHPLYPGTVMFPTEHDIHPEILDECLNVIAELLAAGNNVLVVSKPNLSCINEICRAFAASKDQILFRFTITAKDNTILHFWEPGAPPFEERLSSLCHAFKEGYSTSVSIEPMLDCDNIKELIGDIAPCVTHSIWLGKMNKIEERVICDSAIMSEEIKRIRLSQSDENIKKVYNTFRHNKLIRWKESIKEIVGLELPKEPGLDI
jgi:DNA repair photolyase